MARVVDGFADTDQGSRFNGKPAILLQVFRTGDQGALEIGGRVKTFTEEARAWMPSGVSLTYWGDSTQTLQDRLDLLARNGRNGFLLVVAVLALAAGRLPYSLHYSNKGRDLCARLGLQGCDLADLRPASVLDELFNARSGGFDHRAIRERVRADFARCLARIPSPAAV